MLVKGRNDKELKLEIISGESAVPGAIDCLRYVYGEKENYLNPNAFDVQKMKNKVLSGAVSVFTAIAENGDPVVTLSAKRIQNFDKSLEIGTLAANPEYAGFHLGSLILEHTINECEKAGHSIFFAHVTMLHGIVCKMTELYGFIPSGFLFGACDASKNFTQLNGSSQKQSWAVYVKNSGKTEAVTVYVPEHIAAFAKEIYNLLGIDPVIQYRKTHWTGQCMLESDHDEYHKTLYIYIWKCGDDLLQKISRLEHDCNDPLQAYIIFLNINDSGAVQGFEKLKELGYTFSGLNPLCGNKEFIIMSKTREVMLNYDELKMSPALKNVFEKVKAL